LIAVSCDLLAVILRIERNFGEEARESCERCLSLPIKNEGPVGGNTANGNYNLVLYYLQVASNQATANSKRNFPILAQSYSEEAIRIWSKIYGPTHKTTIDAVSVLNRVLSELS
jgi:hypothetical protein